MSDLHVLSITTNPWLALRDEGQQLSGAQQRQLDYARFLGHYTVVTRSPRALKLSPVNLAPNLMVIPSQSYNDVTFMWDAYRLGGRVCREGRVDCIACSDPFSTALPACWLKRKFGRPLNVHIQADLVDNLYFVRERLQYRAFNWLAHWALRQADTLRVSTSLERDRFVAQGWPPDRVWYVPFYVEPAPFMAAEGSALRQRLLGETFDRLVLFVGRLSRQKDLPTLLQAARRVIQMHPRTLWVIVGHGPRRAALETLARRLGLGQNVRFVGGVSYAEVPAYYAACDVFAVTSLYEGTCMVLLEAALSGKPIVATAFAGAYDAIVDGESGYITPLRDAPAVAQRLIELLADPLLTGRMGAAGREWVLAHFQPSEVLARYQQMWQATACLV